MMAGTDVKQGPVANARIELKGIEIVEESERTGLPRSLFWPWFASNISVLGVSYGAFTLGFGVSFWQAAIAGVVGIVISFALCGVIALAGKRGSAPTMVLSRAAFGVRGNRLPAALSWLLTVGWETVLVILATLATATVLDRLGWGGGTGTKLLAMIVVAAVTIAAGVLGFDFIMRLQTVITLATAALTLVYIVLVFDEISWDAVSALPAGSVLLFNYLAFQRTGPAADDEFDPDRFSRPETKESVRNAYLPFSAGPRRGLPRTATATARKAAPPSGARRQA